MDILAADIGGTNSRFCLFSHEGGVLTNVGSTVVSSRHEDFSGLLRHLFECWPGDAERLRNVARLSFAAAGPVRDGRISMTNASFSVDAREARKLFPLASCLLMNDFEAQAWACLSPVLDGAELLMPGRLASCDASCSGSESVSGEASAPGAEAFRRLAGTDDARAPVAVLGAGTGLGAAWLLPGGGRPFVLPSEGGHMAFPFEGADELAFAAFLQQKRGAPVTAEHVLSGPGLGLLHEHLTGRSEAPQEFTRREGFADSDVCRLFARFYGRFCRMAALALLPQAIVITGGVTEKTPALVRHPEFCREFLRAQGGQLAFLETVPVRLNRHPQSGLWGAACAAVLAEAESWA